MKKIGDYTINEMYSFCISHGSHCPANCPFCRVCSLCPFEINPLELEKQKDIKK